MRSLGLALVTGLSVAGFSAAQQQAGPNQPAAPALDPNRAKLDQVLASWEREMKNVQTLWATCTRTELDKVFKTKKVFDGTAKFMKPNMALLKMSMTTPNRPDVTEEYLCTGTHLFKYIPERKQVRVVELPKSSSGQAVEDNLLSFLFGMKAEDARRRYDLSLAQVDSWYYYVQVLPRSLDDKAEFKRARIVLTKDRILLKQIWFVENNDNEVIWDIKEIEANARINRNEFAYPTKLLPGWTMVKEQPSPKQISPRTEAQPPPRIVRPTNAGTAQP